MKTFFSTLAAILVAAIIIWFVGSAFRAREAYKKNEEEIRRITLKSELSNAQTEWEQKVGPRLDPNAEQLVARLRQIREASEAPKGACHLAVVSSQTPLRAAYFFNSISSACSSVFPTFSTV